MDKEKGYTPEQINNAEKMCQFLQDIPEERRNYIIPLAMMYMTGIEYGIALERDAKQASVGQKVNEKLYNIMPSKQTKQADAKP